MTLALSVCGYLVDVRGSDGEKNTNWNDPYALTIR